MAILSWKVHFSPTILSLEHCLHTRESQAILGGNFVTILLVNSVWVPIGSVWAVGHKSLLIVNITRVCSQVSDLDSLTLVKAGNVAIIEKSDVMMENILVSVYHIETSNARWYFWAAVNFSLVHCRESFFATTRRAQEMTSARVWLSRC